MDIKAFVIADNSKLKPIPSEGLKPEWLKDEVPRWIDVEAPEADKLSEFLAPLGIPQPIIENCLKPSEEPVFVRYENMIYIECPVIIKKHEFQ